MRDRPPVRTLRYRFLVTFLSIFLSPSSQFPSSLQPSFSAYRLIARTSCLIDALLRVRSRWRSKLQTPWTVTVEKGLGNASQRTIRRMAQVRRASPRCSYQSTEVRPGFGSAARTWEGKRGVLKTRPSCATRRTTVFDVRSARVHYRHAKPVGKQPFQSACIQFQSLSPQRRSFAR